MRERSRVTRALSFLPIGLMAVVVLVTYAAIVWTLRRGFDWTDEAFVYTMIASNRIAVEVPLGFQHLLHPLYVLTGENVLVFRVLRLAGYVLLSLALVGCARSVLRQVGISIPRSGWAFILLLSQVGTFLAWSYPPRYVSYNELASWFAQLGAALIVLSLAKGLATSGRSSGARLPGDQSRWWALWSIWAALGVLATLLVFAKVTSAMAFALVLVIAFFIPNPNLRLWKRAVSLAAGTAVALFALWISGVPIRAYLQNSFVIIFDPSAQASFKHPVSKILTVYKESLLTTGRAVVPALLLFGLAMGTLCWKGRGTAKGVVGRSGRVAMSVWVTWILGALLVLALIALPKDIVWNYLGALVMFMGLAGLIGLAFLGRTDGTDGTDGTRARVSAKSRSLSVAVGAAAVMAAPFISAAGTNNILTGQLLFAATIWAVVLGIALVLLAQRAALLRSSARSLPALIGCVVVLLAALAVRADIAQPYRMASLISQDTTSAVPELSGLLLTTGDAEWVDWVSAAGDSLRADSVPATATTSPGALYAFNHSGYASPWVGPKDQQAPYTSLTLACTNKRPRDLLVLQPESTEARAAANVTKALARCGIHFPGDFQVVAKRASTEPEHAMTIWRLKKARPAARG